MAQPVSKQVYRRRRTFAVLILLSLIGAIWWGISAMRSDPGAKQAAIDTGPAKPCASSAVKVLAHIGDGVQAKTKFAAGENPMIWFSLTNQGKVACTFEAGSIGQFFTITTGPDTVWQSAQCDRSADVSAVVTLKPKIAMSSPPSSWLRVSSSESGCGEEQPAVVAGGASYHLTVTVNGVKSANDVQFVLN
ncbi:MAG: hypothetical protein RL670_1129 [Actinomycetota bacterium]|jgi:hypothetical protein